MKKDKILTVTLNPAIDRTLFIPGFRAGEVNRVDADYSYAGGKGVNVASLLSDYGLKITASGFLGEENVGIFESLFKKKNIEDKFIRICGKTRTGIKIINEVQQETTDINFPGVVPLDKDVSKLIQYLNIVADEYQWIVFAGRLFVGPNEKGLDNAAKIIARQNELKNIEYSQRFRPAVTIDDERVEVAANIGSIEDAASAVEFGSEGVGLLRSEFLFLDREEPPTEEEQFKAYTEMVKNLGGLPLTIRTLDIGGDKQITYINTYKEENPFLGIRGLRLCFDNEKLFRSQLKAIIRAAENGPVRIMFPMVSLISEIKKAKNVLEEVRKEVNGPRVEIGIMIEVPSAALMSEKFAQYVDFFSIGTNDLTQYVLAMDRGNTKLAKQADGLNPAVLKMIDMTVNAAHSKGKWVGVCGDLAGDPAAAVILAGLGVDELSVGIPNIPKIKMKIRSIKMSEAKNYSKKALECESNEEVRKLVKDL